MLADDPHTVDAEKIKDIQIVAHRRRRQYRVRAIEDMRIALNVIAVLLVVMGTTWFLQGINVLPGSFMTGQIQWAVYGGMAAALGIVLLIVANRRRRASL